MLISPAAPRVFLFSFTISVDLYNDVNELQFQTSPFFLVIT